MSIKKIKNVVYSPSKSQEAAKWARVQARRYKMLSESDWTQLPDVKLTEFTKARWATWRGRLRCLDRQDYTSVEEYERALDLIERDKNSLYVEYASLSSVKPPEAGKLFLRQLLTSLYTKRVSAQFTPNLEEKYQETLDVVSMLLESRGIPTNDLSMKQLIGFVDGLDVVDIDVSPFPFFELTQQFYGLTIRDTILYILTQKQEQYNFALQEEYNLLHYGSRIESCVTPEDVLHVKNDIELNYGH